MKIFDNCVEKTVLTDADFGDVSCDNTDKPVTGCAVSNAISGMLGKTATGNATLHFVNCGDSDIGEDFPPETAPAGITASAEKPAVVIFYYSKDGDQKTSLVTYFE